jgi:type VI protein secretion system component VasA
MLLANVLHAFVARHLHMNVFSLFDLQAQAGHERPNTWRQSAAPNKRVRVSFI